MFRIDQILSATTFLRSFKEVAQRLVSTSEPLLITQRNGGFIVIMDGQFFEGIMRARHHILSMGEPPEDSAPCDCKS
jgi:hypothetical protein